MIANLTAERNRSVGSVGQNQIDSILPIDEPRQPELSRREIIISARRVSITWTARA